MVVLLSNVSLMFNLFVNPIALENIQWRYYIVYCVILAVSVVFVFFFIPETANLSLEHISEIFKGDFKPWKRGKHQDSKRGKHQVNPIEENLEADGDVKQSSAEHIE